MSLLKYGTTGLPTEIDKMITVLYTVTDLEKHTKKLLASQILMDEALEFSRMWGDRPEPPSYEISLSPCYLACSGCDKLFSPSKPGSYRDAWHHVRCSHIHADGIVDLPPVDAIQHLSNKTNDMIRVLFIVHPINATKIKAEATILRLTREAEVLDGVSDGPIKAKILALVRDDQDDGGNDENDQDNSGDDYPGTGKKRCRYSHGTKSSAGEPVDNPPKRGRDK